MSFSLYSIPSCILGTLFSSSCSVTIDDDGPRCDCGNYGCLETVVSSQVLIREARALLQRSPQSPLHKYLTASAPMTTDMILAAFHAGSDEIRDVIEKMGRYLGMAIASLVGILNIQHIMIGGSLARFGDTLIVPARLEMHQHVQAAQAQETTVSAANLGTDIVIFFCEVKYQYSILIFQG